MQSMNFFSSMRPHNRQFAVIGLGRFGRAVCETLRKQGYQVMGTDIDEGLVAQALSDRIVDNAIELDSTKPNALREAGIFETDTVIVAIGKYVEESIITTLNCKEAGVNFVAAKASSEIHGKLLKKVGADLVVFPEYDAGCELVHRLTRPSILERFDLDPEHSIVELKVPEAFHGKTLAELGIRNRYGLNIVAVGNAEKFKINPDPQERLYKDLAMVVIGSNRDIQRLPI
jgi:trk system potassium uptake protein TrkA